MLLSTAQKSRSGHAARSSHSNICYMNSALSSSYPYPKKLCFFMCSELGCQLSLATVCCGDWWCFCMIKTFGWPCNDIVCDDMAASLAVGG